MKTILSVLIIFSLQQGWSMSSKKQMEMKPLSESLPKTRLGSDTDFTLPPKKYLILDFWASWCEPCKDSFPFYENALNKKKSEKWNFVTIALDPKKLDAENFLQKFPFSGIALWDEGGKLAKRFGINALPSFFIIDDKDQIVFQQIGFSENKKQLILQKLRELNL